ncbi:DGQHR domain-containing protein [Rhizobium ruizarguesonis]|uniref:DGQHR domain-containing protein n=1 Tax=Rhizobium ruizarguesonis TaxID=2081791 RepID=UPI00103145A3|nr:DGQHR domain-containing protein [Rhizobium ruizarguesonis]TBC84251.1 DGQHR domain-containing protein [Rhizobium ruizarguesonis]
MLQGLVSGDDLKSIYNARGKNVDEKTVSAASTGSLSLKIQAEEADGWAVSKSNKRSVRMTREKPTDRQLEDDVWSLMYRMGFSELNIDRNFKIQLNDKAPPRQLDVFAKDNDTVFVVECTHAKESVAKSVKALIDKISAIREDVVKAVHSHYGKEPKLKVKFAIATRNIETRAADLARAKEAGIAVITEDDLGYFRRLTDILKSAARFQFLARYLEGEKVEGLRTRVPATRGRVGKTTFYNFLISPHDLLRISYISHMGKASNGDLETYQRMVKPARLKSIGAYIDEGGTFPTNIVINVKQSSLNFQAQENFGETSTGILTLPGQYGTAWVIDGQHRLYGYAYANRDPSKDHSVISVLAYENIPIREEIQMFVDINTQQVKVSRNLVNEIVSNLDVEHEDPSRRLEAICARTALRLDSNKKSPVKGRILTVAQEKNNFRCLTLTSLADGIYGNDLIGKVGRSSKSGPVIILPGPLGEAGQIPNLTLEKATETLLLYFDLFALPLSEHWKLGDAKGGYLCTNLGLRALLSLLKKLIVFVEKDGRRCVLMEPDQIVDAVRPLVAPIVDYFMRADPADIARFRNRGSSLASVDQNCLQLMAIISEANPEFAPQEVRDYLDSQDAEGTKRAKEMIDEINRILFRDVIGTLKQKYGESKDIWWLQGVPKTVRNYCDQQYNENGNTDYDRWQYLFLVNYSDIVLYGNNWDDFKDYYNFYGKGKKETLVRWIAKLNKARTVTHHAEKGPLSKEQVAFVTRVHELVKRHIEQREPVDIKARYLAEEDEVTSVAA